GVFVRREGADRVGGHGSAYMRGPGVAPVVGVLAGRTKRRSPLRPSPKNRPSPARSGLSTGVLVRREGSDRVGGDGTLAYSAGGWPPLWEYLRAGQKCLGLCSFPKAAF